MKKYSLFKRSVSFVTALLILISLSLSLFSCQREATKEQMMENVSQTVANDTLRHEYVTLYLYDWNFPSFDTKKMSRLQAGEKAAYEYKIKFN